MKLNGHRSPWDERDTKRLYYDCLRAGLMQSQIAERLGRTPRAIKAKIYMDRYPHVAGKQAAQCREYRKRALPSRRQEGE